MAADLALATDLGVVERSADPAGFVVQACERAKVWLREALEHGEIEQIAEIRSQAEAIRVYTAQKQLGKDAQLAAAEIVRRAERGIGLAIRRGQQTGQIARRGDRGSRGAPGVHGGNPGDRRGDHLGSPAGFFRHGDERADAYAMTDGVCDTDFEDALGEAGAEGNLSRANVVRKVRQRRGSPPASGRWVPDPADRSPGATMRRRELIGEFAARGMSSQQIGERLGIGDDQARHVAREHGIDIRADAVLGRTRRPDSSRIVRETVRLHAVLCDLVPGGVPDEITAAQAGRILDQLRPAGPAAGARGELAAELLADLRHLDTQRREAKTKLAAAVKASGTSLTRRVFGAGPVIAGMVIGDIRQVSRLPSRDHFAAYNGTAPAEVSSGNRKIYRLSRRGGSTVK